MRPMSSCLPDRGHTRPKVLTALLMSIPAARLSHVQILLDWDRDRTCLETGAQRAPCCLVCSVGAVHGYNLIQVVSESLTPLTPATQLRRRHGESLSRLP